MALFAPLAVSVQIRSSDRRVFRLSYNVAESGMTLERSAPFEIGRPVSVTFTFPGTLPDDPVEPLTLRAVVALTDDDGEGADGGRSLEFVNTVREQREAIFRYVAGRLGLPGGAFR